MRIGTVRAARCGMHVMGLVTRVHDRLWPRLSSSAIARIGAGSNNVSLIAAQILSIGPEVGPVPCKISLVGVNVGPVVSDVASVVHHILSLRTTASRRLTVRHLCACSGPVGFRSGVFVATKFLPIFPEILPVIAQVLPIRAKVGPIPRKILLVGVDVGLVASDVASILRDILPLSTGAFRRLIVRGSRTCLRICLRCGGSRSRVIVTATLVPPIIVQILPIRAKVGPVPRKVLLVGVDVGLVAGDVASILRDILSLRSAAVLRLIVRRPRTCLWHCGSRSGVIVVATQVLPIAARILPIGAEFGPIALQVQLVSLNIGLIVGNVAPIFYGIRRLLLITRFWCSSWVVAGICLR